MMPPSRLKTGANQFVILSYALARRKAGAISVFCIRRPILEGSLKHDVFCCLIQG